jgi:hypothetical protein
MNKRVPGYNPLMFNDSGYGSGSMREAYRPGQTFIPAQEYRNPGTLIHNNVGETVLNEQISEYKIHIDSIDRDLTLYPSQFDFKVTFDGNAQPAIGRRLKNVKYIKLNEVVIPNSHKIISNGADPPVYIFSTDTDQQFIYERLLILQILEADSGKLLSTNQYFTTGCFVLYPDTTYGDFSAWLSRSHTVVFPDSSLMNMNRLSIKLMDQLGDTFVMTGMESEVTTQTDLRYYLCPRTQMTIELTVGVVENFVNTNVQYAT